MKKSVLSQFQSGSAEQVVAHAAWQHSRGRKPSMSFQGEGNPRKALELAKVADSRNKSKRVFRNIYGPPKRINDGTYSIDVPAGLEITGTIAEAISVARGLDATIQFMFNGVTVSVRSDSNPKIIYRDWSRSLSGYIADSIGPNPNPVLTDEEKASDARIEDKNKRRLQKSQAEYEAKAKAKQEAVEAKLVNAPDIELANEAVWQKFKTVNSDSYGGGIITYTERWARLMQVEMANGKKLEDVADSTSRESDLEGMSGFSYGCAVSTLSKCWRHGEQLRRWHNIETQLSNEGDKANESGGIINPALLSIR